MLKHLYLIILSTLVMGFFTGVYVYFLTRTQVEEPIDQPTRDGFIIVADVYGGCELLGTCPSYRIDEDGDYMYVVRERGSEDLRFEDSLSEQRRDELEALLRSTDFESIEDSEFQGTCPVAFDGPAYVYTIEYEGEDHDIDTCIEDVGGVELFETLADQFEIFRLTHAP